MLQLNPIIANGAVFATNKPIRIFGSGNGHVAIDFLGEHVETDSTHGTWLVELSPRPYGGPYEMKITLGTELTVLSDLYVGEVILASGQSNMGFSMAESKDYPELATPCDMLRVFTTERVQKNGFYRPCDGWKSCADPEVIRHCTAIGFEVGIDVCKAKGCAVGVISCAQGASVIQSWLPVGTLNRLGLSFAKEQLHSDHFKFPIWNKDGVLYQAMLAPCAPYSLSHIVWYQGESNASIAESAVYGQMLSELIRVWRQDFDDSALPVILVQLADNLSRMTKGIGWKTIQDVQLHIQHEISNVQTVVCADVCENDDIHPPTKRFLSARIAALIKQTI